jgi:hypothetical protein
MAITHKPIEQTEGDVLDPIQLNSEDWSKKHVDDGIQDQDISMSAHDIVLDTTTGTKIGTGATQKLGFYGATPIVKAVLATGASHTVDDIITALQNLGLVRQA